MKKDRTKARGGLSVFLRSALVALLLAPLQAQTLPKAKPEELGLSSERLQRINEVIQRYIDSNQISGAVTLVARKGRIAQFESYGLMDSEAKKPIRKDALFRMASSTKPSRKPRRRSPVKILTTYCASSGESLRKRAWPFVDMLQRCVKDNASVTWGV